jgi:hypothetical protein
MLVIVLPLQSSIVGHEGAWEILGTLPLLILFGYIFGIVPALLTDVAHPIACLVLCLGAGRLLRLLARWP